jgi:hypothetical protein
MFFLNREWGFRSLNMLGVHGNKLTCNLPQSKLSWCRGFCSGVQAAEEQRRAEVERIQREEAAAAAEVAALEQDKARAEARTAAVISDFTNMQQGASSSSQCWHTKPEVLDQSLQTARVLRHFLAFMQLEKVVWLSTVGMDEGTPPELINCSVALMIVLV